MVSCNSLGCSCIYCVGFAQKSGPVLARPSPATYPESCTNLSADLVEAVSLVICEEITWRPFLFRLSDPGPQNRIEFLLTRFLLVTQIKSWFPIQAVSTSNFIPVTVKQHIRKNWRPTWGPSE